MDRFEKTFRQWKWLNMPGKLSCEGDERIVGIEVGGQVPGWAEGEVSHWKDCVDTSLEGQCVIQRRSNRPEVRRETKQPKLIPLKAHQKVPIRQRGNFLLLKCAHYFASHPP